MMVECVLAASFLFGGTARSNTIVQHGRCELGLVLGSGHLINQLWASDTMATEQDGFGHRGSSSITIHRAYEAHEDGR